MKKWFVDGQKYPPQFGLLLTLPFLPATELLGHLPIFAVMYVLLFLPSREEQMIG
jgi:hypothetical protein